MRSTQATVAYTPLGAFLILINDSIIITMRVARTTKETANASTNRSHWRGRLNFPTLSVKVTLFRNRIQPYNTKQPQRAMMQQHFQRACSIAVGYTGFRAARCTPPYAALNNSSATSTPPLLYSGSRRAVDSFLPRQM